MHTFIARPTLDHLNPLRKILPRDWHKFGVEYRSVQTDSAGFCTGGQLHDGRRFTWDNLENRYRFTKKETITCRLIALYTLIYAPL